MTVKRMDNVGIVVENIDAAIEFFIELGLELEGRAPIEGDWADGVTGLHDMCVEIAEPVLNFVCEAYHMSNKGSRYATQEQERGNRTAVRT